MVKEINLDAKSEKAVKVDIRGYQVLFPCEPYKQQVEFMESLIQTLEGADNALLESPTGTGKTLSLLAGILSWMKTKQDEGKEKRSRLFFASRTHAQISQLVSELKSTAYVPTISILASRDHFCLNSEAKELKGGQLISKCHQLIKNNACDHYNSLQRKKKTLVDYYSNTVMDVEELFAEGSRQHFCPYYFSKLMVQESHVVFLPYSFLTHEDYLWMLEGQLNNSILVFDEAHNVGDSAEEVNSSHPGVFIQVYQVYSAVHSR